MSARIFVLCLLSSVISTAASLKCQTCFASAEECRNEDMEELECEPDEDHCLTISFKSTMMDLPLSFTAKGCATVDQCSEGYYGFTSVGNKHQQVRLACCEEDSCNTGPLPVPGRDLLKPNGFTCPGSYQQNGFSEVSGPVVCLGDEDQCFNVTITTDALQAFRAIITVQGCANRNGCAYPTGSTVLGNGLLRFNLEIMECQNPVRLERMNNFSKTFGWGWY